MNYKLKKGKCLLLILLSSIYFGCEKSKTENVSIHFQDSNPEVQLNETLKMGITYKEGYDESDYDNDKNPLGLEWSVTDEDILSVTQSGKVTGENLGAAFVKAKSKDGIYSISTEVFVGDESLLGSLTQPLDEEMIYSKGNYLVRNTVIQSIDVDSGGSIYYDQLGGNLKQALFVVKGEPNQQYDSAMQLDYFGHGTNMVIEENGADRYVWINSNGSKKSDGSYGSNATFSRIKFEPDQTIKNYGGETYYLEGRRNIHPALDIENDILGVTYSGGGEPRGFSIYKLSEARELEEKEVELPSLTYGGEDGVPEETVNPNVKVKDLGELEPIASFDVEEGSDYSEFNSYYFQGFDISDEKIYFHEGEGNGNDPNNGPSNAFVTVLDFNGKPIGKRTRVEAINDLDDLKTYGITETGYMESEGIKKYGNKLYLGFASRSTDNKRRGNILVFEDKKDN